MRKRLHRVKEHTRFLVRAIGPGVITGASDDDPSGIATYSQAGATFGFSMLWTALFTFPLMAAIQEISGRIGRVTGKGIASNIRSHYSARLLYVVVTLLLVANTLNIGADLGAMGAAMELLTGINHTPFIIGFALLCICLEVFLSYKQYVPILQWLVLSLFAYVATAFIVDIPWSQALLETLVPQITFSQDYLLMLVAVLGTTISPYLFFWQSSQEMEEIRANRNEHALIHDLPDAPRELRRMRIETTVGMLFSNAISFFIILTTAATLHASGVGSIATAADAARALEPLAGGFASALFAAGIIGTGLLAVPVLAGSAAFGVGEALRWPVGLERRALKAKGFYSIIAAATLIGLFLNFFGIDPIKALVWVAVINAVVSVPLMVLLLHMGSNVSVMGSLTIGPGLRLLGWIATIVVAAASACALLIW